MYDEIIEEGRLFRKKPLLQNDMNRKSKIK